jgi:hypothetical protein
VSLLAVRADDLGSVRPVGTDPGDALRGAPDPDDRELGVRFAAGDEQALALAY